MRKRWLQVLLLLLTASLLIALRTVYYQINPDRCWNCGRCVWHCPTGAIQFDQHQGTFTIDQTLCDGCGTCVQYCPYGAINQVTANEDEVTPPVGIKLKCSPNPARGQIRLQFDQPLSKTALNLFICNSKGQKVFWRHLDKEQSSFVWNGKDKAGSSVAAGIYTAIIEGGGFRAAQTIIWERP